MTLTIDGDLNFDAATSVAEDLKGAFKAGEEVILRLGKLGKLDLCGAQLLFSAWKTAQKVGVSFMVDPGTNEDRLRKILNYAGLPQPPMGDRM
jgi:anti-anti-sigma regulatory factor